MPLRSHGSLSMNRALMAAGLVDRVQVTIFPVITGQTGTEPIFQGAADFDLELIAAPDARRPQASRRASRLTDRPFTAPRDECRLQPPSRGAAELAGRVPESAL